MLLKFSLSISWFHLELHYIEACIEVDDLLPGKAKAIDTSCLTRL